jgi:hypothetical protein
MCCNLFVCKMTAPGRSSLPFAFVLMPFGHDFLKVYEKGIKPAARSARVRCERVDEQNFDVRILDRIYEQIQAADIVIADMTGRNPNVFYELGYAHAIRKRVLLLARTKGDIPFDLTHHPCLIYGDETRGKGPLGKLKKDLELKLKWAIREPQQEVEGSWSPTVQRISQILGELSKTVAGRLQMGPLLESIVRDVGDILDAEVCSIFLNTAKHPNTISCVAGSGFASNIVGKAKYRKGEGFTGQIFQRAQTIIIGSSEDLKQLRESGRFQGKYDHIQWAVYSGKSQFRNCIACPLRLGDATCGVIKVENKRHGEFTAGDATILEAIANGVLAVALQNARSVAATA